MRSTNRIQPWMFSYKVKKETSHNSMVIPKRDEKRAKPTFHHPPQGRKGIPKSFTETSLAHLTRTGSDKDLSLEDKTG